MIGCLLGGLVVPGGLFVVASLLGDTGGPLFWPFVMVVLGGLGLLTGSIVGALKK